MTAARRARRGMCRYCRCTWRKPCRTQRGPCCWLDAGQTICSNPDCIVKAVTDKFLRKMRRKLLPQIKAAIAAMAGAR